MPNFVSVAASIAELAGGEKLRTQSVTHSPSLFDANGQLRGESLKYESTTVNMLPVAAVPGIFIWGSK